MYKVNFCDLAIAVTHKCNMGCAHCLRGNAEAVDISDEVLEDIFQHTADISNLTFTGGEPSLNVAAMEKALELAKKYNVHIGAFYVVTNGKGSMDDFERFAMACLRWYAYCDEKDMCGISVSRDMFHEWDTASRNVFELLRGFAFFNENDKTTDWERSQLINEGRAKELPSSAYNKREQDDPSWQMFSFEVSNSGQTIYVGEDVVSINANGEITPGCDYSWETQHTCAAKFSNMEEAIEAWYAYATDPKAKII